MVKEYRATWTGPGHSPKYNIFHSEDSEDADLIKGVITAFYTSIAPHVNSSFQVKLDPTYRTLVTATGALVADTPYTIAPLPVSGSSAGAALPDAAAVLCRWNTGVIVSGRFLRGRTFLPGCTVGLMAAGNLAGSGYTTLNSAASTLAGATPRIAIWSRAHGVLHPVQAGSVWNEVATQRRRRG